MRILICLLLVSTSVSAEVFKCTQSGYTIYSTAPCVGKAAAVTDRTSVSLDSAPHSVFLPKTSPVPQPVLVLTQTHPQQPQPLLKPQNCNSEDARLERVRSIMRRGYPQWQSASLHQEQMDAMKAQDDCMTAMRN